MEQVPFEDRHVPKAEVDWERSAWWWIPLTRAVRPATKLTTLVWSLLAIWILRLGVFLGNSLFQPETWRFPLDQISTAVSARLEPPWLQFLGENWLLASPVVRVFLAVSAWFWRSLPVTGNDLAYFSFLTIWFSITMALFGGVLARRAMVELGQQTIAPWGESLQLVFSRWLSYLWATGMHLVGLVGLLLPIALIGLLARAGTVGANIAGVLLLLLFPLVFALGRLLLSMVFCFPTSVCAIAAEKKADAFEGFSRSNAYVFQRPVVAVLCLLVLLTFGLVGEQIIAWSLWLGWGAVRSVLSLCAEGIVDFPSLEGGPLASFVGIGNELVQQLILAYWFSYFWAAQGAIYLILRRSVDSTDLHELDAIENPVVENLPEIPRTPPQAQTKDSPSSNASAEAESGDADAQDATE